MSGCSTSVSTEVRDPNRQDAVPDCAKLSDACPLPRENEVEEEHKQGDGNGNNNMHQEEDDDEDEDTDFNPFVIENEYVEASSSLSSEVEDLDMDVADSRGKSCVGFDTNSKEKHGDIMKDCDTSGNVELGEEIVMQTALSSGEACGKVSDTTHIVTTQKESVLIAQSENESLCDKEIRSNSLTDVSNGTDAKKLVVDMDTEGAICMRTRARYSLASFTLDELETFLQETDDEDDLQNVDDEKEYRKFLAAVLRGDDPQNLQGNANADDEDEENDADFELELEEALESEPEEIEEPRRTTRRNKSQKSSLARSKKLSGQLSRPLRPLLPFASIECLSAFDGKHLPPNIAPSFMPPVNIGFTPHQIGQLHCLIHEHVQLLIQVFSICVIEPATSHIAAEVKELVVEMLQKRDQVLTNRMIPHPSFCFSPPYIHPSIIDGQQKMLPPNGSKTTVHQHSAISSLSNQRNKNLNCEQANSSQTTERTSWVPYICGPVLSVMDVAPLKLVGNYVDEVSSAVRAFERSPIEIDFESLPEKEPLFPFHGSPCSAESDGQGEIENTPPDSSGMISCSSSSQIPKKSIAAALLEKTKNQTVALVPKEIAELAQRFWPLFNPALYPHKPPPASLAHRVLFTDSEDELLALGLMEYNNDWKAIQKRFLPCKSRHQIFVRQKNRTSSKAPENPIKAVRTMKNSPLSSEEIARIEVGLKKFKLDWISIWRFFVPYRDPSLLPRQWRIACGTQKSYKLDANKKAKRRLYALGRKTSKPSHSKWHSSSEKEGDSTDNAVEETNGGDNHLGKGDEAYVHEAFLADWRPKNNVSSSFPTSLASQEGSQARDIQPQMLPKSPATLRSSVSQVVLRPYRARRPNNAHLVKLAPGLPPVNLPASVRIMSQSDFKSSQAVAAAKISVNASRMAGPVVENGALHSKSIVKSGVVGSTAKSGQSMSSSVSISAGNKRVAERGGDSDLQMHPLLFQAPQDGRMPYYPPNSSTMTSSSFTFFSGKQQPKLSLGLFHNPRHIRDAVNFLSMSSKPPPQENTSSTGVDFHPLLQKTDDIDSASAPSIVGSRQKRALIPKPSASTNKLLLDGNSSGTKVASVKRKVNELDLNIHPCFTSNNKESDSAKDSSNKRDDTPRGISDEFDSGETQLVTSRTKGSRKASDITRNESLPEIVMEQEELSDSEEEFGENVEFECEEMTDSEGDSISDSEQIVDLPDEDEMDVHIDNACEKGIHVKPKILTLNLNSFPPLSPNPNGDDEFEPFGTTSTCAQNRLTPSSKGSSSKHIKPGQIKKNSKDALPRNPRKRVCRSKSNSIPKMEMNVKKKLKNVSTDE